MDALVGYSAEQKGCSVVNLATLKVALSVGLQDVRKDATSVMTVVGHLVPLMAEKKDDWAVNLAETTGTVMARLAAAQSAKLMVVEYAGEWAYYSVARMAVLSDDHWAVLLDA